MLLISAFAANAQTENFNEEQTIKYINQTWHSNFQVLDCWLDLYIVEQDAAIQTDVSLDSTCRDSRYATSIPMYSKPLVGVKAYKKPNDSSMTLYMVTCDTWPLLTCIKSEAAAEKLKKAVIHLYKLIESRK